MLEVAVIADDLTGAADTGVQFHPAFAPIYMGNHRFGALDAFAPPPRVVSLFTASRGLSPPEAYREVFTACRVIAGLAPRRIYKKIDSALRGNLGAELEAVMSAFNLALSLIAPAFIEQGRTTVDGIHCIHGKPVANTDMGCDPVSPVHASRLPDRVGQQACLPVAHIELATLERGPDATARAIDCAFNRGSRHFTFDAAAREHLDRIAHVALSRYPQALLCGSAGLAGSMARALAAGQSLPPAGVSRIGAALSGHWLFACGSASERLHQQVTTNAAGFLRTHQLLFQRGDGVSRHQATIDQDLLRRQAALLRNLPDLLGLRLVEQAFAQAHLEEGLAIGGSGHRAGFGERVSASIASRPFG